MDPHGRVAAVEGASGARHDLLDDEERSSAAQGAQIAHATRQPATRFALSANFAPNKRLRDDVVAAGMADAGQERRNTTGFGRRSAPRLAELGSIARDEWRGLALALECAMASTRRVSALGH